MCYHFKLNCLRVKASSIACSVSVLSRQLTAYWCVITCYEFNCLRVTAFSVTYSVKCVIGSIVYWRVITYYEVSCMCVTTFSVTCSVKFVVICNCYSTLMCYGSRAQLSACYRFRCYRQYKFVTTSSVN